MIYSQFDLVSKLDPLARLTKHFQRNEKLKAKEAAAVPEQYHGCSVCVKVRDVLPCPCSETSTVMCPSKIGGHVFRSKICPLTNSTFQNIVKKLNLKGYCISLAYILICQTEIFL